ncbi:MAG: oligosaccharide flippase family protein [Tissierellia bacterium]|nr:oligosaccharide flippase family protein [Tissierellia bacterium]
MQNSNRQIKIGGIISYLTIGFSIISGLIYTPWMISVIGQSNFGLYTLATSLVTMVTIDLGLSSAVTRFISKYRAKNDIESIRKFLGIAYKLFIALAIIFLVSLTIVYFNVDRIFLKLTPDEIEKVKVLLSIAGLYAVISFPFHPLDGLLVSGEWFIFQKSTALVNKVLNIALMITALLMGYGLYSLVVVNAFSGLVIIGMKLYFLKKYDPQQIEWKGFDTRLTREIFSFSLWVMVISIAQRLILNITPSVLGITSGSREIAIFSAAMTIEGYVWTFATVFSGMFLPKVSRLIYGDNAGPEAIQTLMIKVGRIQFILLAAIVSIFIVTGRGFILNWLGIDFEKSYLITVLLILPGLITIPQEIASTTLIASNQVRYNALSRIIIAVISISLSYLLSLKFGSTGAGIAIFIGNMIGGAIILNIIYARVLKINVWAFFRKCQISMAFPFVLVLFFGFTLNYFIKEVSWLNTLIKIIILSLIYSLSAYYYAINSYEKELVFGAIRKMINK